MKTAVLGAVLLFSTAWAGQSAEDIQTACGIKGGLVVHIGCGDGRQTAALWTGDAFLVHGLDTKPADIAKARAHVDNLVNLIIAEDLGKVAMSEVIRALCPGGVAYVKKQGAWTKTVKPWPDGIDEWTHYLHGPDNNAVAEDYTVGPPRRFQWICRPRFSRSHDHLASTSAMVTAGGRLFYVIDTGSIAFAAATAEWRLVARDAFNGVKLWDRPITTWENHLRDFRSGPADIARRLVAVGDRLYVTLGYGEPVSILDAATGKTIRTCTGTEGTREILYSDNTLFLVLASPDKDWRAEQAREIVSKPGYRPPFETFTPPACQSRVMAVDADTGKTIWKNTRPYTHDMMPSTLAVAAGRVYFQNTDAIVCLDAATGKLRWKTPRPVHRRRLAWSTPTLVVGDGVVFSADRGAAQTDTELLWIPSGGYHEYIRGEGIKGELIALDGETGKRLWSCPAYEGFNAPVDVMIADGLLWTGRYAWGNDPGITEGRDPRTGQVRRRRPRDQEVLPHMGHARCHRAKATSRYLILGRRGVEFIDVRTGDITANFWVRGICQYGVMPANGLLYIPPHSCACSVGDMLKSGFIALAPGTEKDTDIQPLPEQSPQRGPAYGFAPVESAADKDAWPTYRCDAARSGATTSAVSHDLRVTWQTNIGGKLTSPVTADGLLLVAQTNAHRIHALETATGKSLWTFAAGARIDSPPTIDRGRVLFGSADGWVYCLRLRDGALIWKFQAAPRNRRIVVRGQLESPWPVSGNVLVIGDAVYFAAGRNSYLDGGMLLYKLDTTTGRRIKVVQLAVEREKRDGGVASGGYLPDILSTDGESIFMRNGRFDLDLVRQKGNVAHLWSAMGFLDDSWWHRSYWQIGTSMFSGWGGWPKAGRRVPAGRLLVTDGRRVFGFGRNQYDIPGAHVGIDAEGVWGPVANGLGRWTFYRLFGQTMDRHRPGSSRDESKMRSANRPDWTQRVGLLVKAMVLADNTLFVAGPSAEADRTPHKPSEVNSLAEAMEAVAGGRMLAVSTVDGKVLGGCELKSPPVFDGMAAAKGRLYISTMGGAVICMGPSVR